MPAKGEARITNMDLDFTRAFATGCNNSYVNLVKCAAPVIARSITLMPGNTFSELQYAQSLWPDRAR